MLVSYLLVVDGINRQQLRRGTGNEGLVEEAEQGQEVGQHSAPHGCCLPQAAHLPAAANVLI